MVFYPILIEAFAKFYHLDKATVEIKIKEASPQSAHIVTVIGNSKKNLTVSLSIFQDNIFDMLYYLVQALLEQIKVEILSVKADTVGSNLDANFECQTLIQELQSQYFSLEKELKAFEKDFYSQTDY